MDENDVETVVDKVVETAENDNEKKEESEASYLLIILFYLLGTASFAPHNFYVTANEYWMYKFRNLDSPLNDTLETKSDLQKNFTASLGITNNVGMICFLFLLLIVHKKISLRKRIAWSMSMLVVLFAITFVFIYVDTDSWQFQFYRLSLTIGGLMNGFSVVLLISLFQLATRFPVRCLVAQMAGQNVCGILAAVVQIISLAAEPTVKGTASLYYAVAVATIAAIMVFYMVVAKRSEQFRSKLYMEAKDVKKPKKQRPKFDFGMLKRVFGKLVLLIIAIVISVVTSGILHPGLTALIESSNKGASVWSDDYFIPVCVFFSFNTFEFIGREVSNHIAKLKNKYVLFVTSVLRLLLLPLILLCNIQPRVHLPVIFHDDAYFITFMILLALTGGYLANVSILAIQKYCSPEERMMGTLFIVLIMIVVVPLVSILSRIIVNII